MMRNPATIDIALKPFQARILSVPLELHRLLDGGRAVGTGAVIGCNTKDLQADLGCSAASWLWCRLRQHERPKAGLRRDRRLCGAA